MKRLVFPILLGVVGCAILIALGVWQLQRMEWKNAIIARIEARIAEAPVDLPQSPDPTADAYLPVTVTGTLGGAAIRVFDANEGLGIGYRLLAAFYAGDRSLVVDLGFIPQEDEGEGRMAEGVTVTGNLLWPDEVTGSTPPPDSRGVWYARDVPGIAAALGVEPVLVVAREIQGADLAVVPVPVGTAGIRNNHFEYVVTWFSLALVWAVMSFYFALRVRRQKD